MTLQLLHAQGIASFAEAPDDILLRTFIAAANETEAELARRLRIGGRVGIETVLSSGKYRGLVEETEKLGGRFRLIYIALSSPEIAVARVASRVMTGGHDVPADKIRNRWKRSLDELPWFLRRASVAWVFDNSLEGAELVATVCSGNAIVRGNLFAELARALAAV